MISSSLVSRFVSPTLIDAPVAQATSRGETVVVVSGVTAPNSTVLLRGFLPSCARDTAFGEDGSETMMVRVGVEAQTNIVISSAAAGPAGSVILAGSGDDGMVIGVVDADGQIDHGFGSKGWKHLPWPGQPTALLREPSGEIVLGIQEGMDCCESEFLGAISPAGSVLTSFGVAGKATLLGYSTGPEGSHINQIARAGNSDLLVVSTGGHMGSLASVVSEFTPNGQSVAVFDHNMNVDWPTSHLPSVFVGGVVVRPGGFAFVGAGQADPVGMSPEPSAVGRLLPFNDAGKPVSSLDGSERSKFPSSTYWNVWAFSRPNGGYLMIAASSPYESERSIGLKRSK